MCALLYSSQCNMAEQNLSTHLLHLIPTYVRFSNSSIFAEIELPALKKKKAITQLSLYLLHDFNDPKQ